MEISYSEVGDVKDDVYRTSRSACTSLVNRSRRDAETMTRAGKELLRGGNWKTGFVHGHSKTGSNKRRARSEGEAGTTERANIPTTW